MKAVLVALGLIALAPLPARAQGPAYAYVSSVQADACTNPGDTNCTRGLLYYFDTATGNVLTSFDLWRGQSGAVAIGAIQAHPNGQIVYVATSSSTGGLLSVDTTSGVVHSVGAGVACGPLGISGDGSRLYCSGVSHIYAIDTSSEQIVADLPAGFVEDIVLASDGHTLYAAQNGQVTIYDLSTSTTAATINTMTRTPTRLALSADGAELFVAGGDTVLRVNTASRTVIGSVVPLADRQLTGIALARGRLFVSVIVSDGFAGKVFVFDPETFAMLDQFNVIDPLKFSVTADESVALLSNLESSKILAIDTSSDAQRFVPNVAVGLGAGTAPAPISPFSTLVLDTPSAGTLAQPFDLTGWAVDAQGFVGPGIDAVHVWVYPSGGGAPIFVTAAQYGLRRPDAMAALGSQYLASGFRATVRGLAAGTYQFVAFGHSAHTGTFSVARSLVVNVSASPLMAIDAPSESASVTGFLNLEGWALDLGAGSGSGIGAVHVWAYPAGGGTPFFVGAATLGVSRPDVAAAFGPQFGAAGYALTTTGLPVGSYTLRVFAYDVLTGTFAVSQTRAVTVDSTVGIAIDTPSSGAVVIAPFVVAGWAIDSSASSGTGIDAVHVWAFPTQGGAPIFVGAATLGISRPDVGALIGSQFSGSGYGLTGASLPAGDYMLVVYARSTVTGTFSGQAIHAIVN